MKFTILVSICLQLCLAVSISAQTTAHTNAHMLRQQIRSALLIPDELPAQEAELHGKFIPIPGVVAERITYNTLYGLKITAVLYLPDPLPTEKIPAMIVVNGHGGDKYSWYSYYSGMIFAKGGAAVLTYDPIGEGERNIHRESGTRAHDVVLDNPEFGRRMGGLMVTDLMQGVSYLTQRTEVDPDRIAAVGYSMGSFVLSLTGAIDSRIHAVVLAGGGNLDEPGGYWDNSKPMCQGIPYQSLSFLGDRPAVIYSLHASRGPLFIYNGLQDSTVSVPRLGTWSFFDDLYKRTEKLRGSSEGLFDYDFYDAAHRPYFVTKPVVLWLEQQIDFPDWSEADVLAMPVTHISEWAERNGADMDHRYASENREGGTRALGMGLPVLSRKDLSVFTDAQWEIEKDKLIYESWLKATKESVLK